MTEKQLEEILDDLIDQARSASCYSIMAFASPTPQDKDRSVRADRELNEKRKEVITKVMRAVRKNKLRIV